MNELQHQTERRARKPITAEESWRGRSVMGFRARRCVCVVNHWRLLSLSFMYDY